MAHNRTTSAKSIVANLQRAPRLSELHPIAARFVYSVRLMALHERAGRDPVPELSSRLGSVDVAAKSLALAKTIMRCWPENIHVSRFCCGLISHDEVTIGGIVSSAVHRDYDAFVHCTHGLIRPDRAPALWEGCNDLVIAELSAG
ncbi:MAG: DNA-directed RNA polymerase subunit beta' [Pseudomonadota bacterium]